MATLKEPFALDRSLNTTELTPRNIADVLAEGFSHITGRTASEVEYDNTDSGLISDDVQGAIDELSERPTLPSVDIQTAVDEFETYNGGILDSLKVALSPNQDLHGYDSPWVGGAGKNKAPYTLANLITSNTSGTWNSNVYTLNGVEFTVYTDDGGNVIAIKANGQNNGNQSLFVLYFTLKDSNTYIVSGCPSGGASPTYEVYANLGNGSVYDRGSGATTTAVANYNGYVSIAIRAGYNAQNLMFYPMLRLSTETDATFESYTNICPISGHTEVKINNGKNLIGLGTRLDGYAGTSFFETVLGAVGYYFKTSDLPDVVTVSDVGGNRAYVSYYNEVPAYGVVYLSKDQSQQTVPKTFTVDKTAEYVHIQLSYGTTDVTNIQIEEGSTATAYEPYNGYQVTVNLGGTYYSGTLDVVSGVFTPDTAEKTLNGSEGLSWQFNNNTAYQSAYVNATSVLPNVQLKSGQPYISNVRYNYFKNIIYASDRAIGCAYIDNGWLNLIFEPNKFATSADLNTFLSNNPLQINYPVATPQSIQLSPTMVKALVGENHLSAPLDGQEITESKYKQAFTFDDVIAYIQSLS